MLTLNVIARIIITNNANDDELQRMRLLFNYNNHNNKNNKKTTSKTYSLMKFSVLTVVVFVVVWVSIELNWNKICIFNYFA